jgi:hypothetical protein
MFILKTLVFIIFILLYPCLFVSLQPMKYLLTVIMAFVGTVVYAQLRIDNRPVIYDSESNIMMVTIPQSDFGSSKRYKIELEEGWSKLKINGSTVGDSYYFNTITGGKKYSMTIKNKDQFVVTSSITFTFLPILQLNGDFGYDYQEGTVSLYTPDGEIKEALTGKLKWRGGTTNTDDKHKRNYKIKFDEDVQLFGLRKDNNWILDAGQADLFRVRNRIATELWNDMATKPYYADKEPEALSGVRGQMVELFLNKEYRGIYCLTEAMDRKQMKLKKVDKNTGEIKGCLYKSEGYGASLMSKYPDTYDNNSETWDTFEMKYPELDDTQNGETDWSTLWNAINFVATSSDNDFKDHIAEYFDIPVIIDYYIFINVLNAFDNVGKNMFWAVYDKTKDKKLTPGVWDLDATVGQKWVSDHLKGTYGAYSPEYDMSAHTNLTKRLAQLDVDGFNDKVIKRYHELRQNILSTDNLIARYTKYFDRIYLSGAAGREENKWSEDTDINEEELNFEQEIYYISYWLARHLVYLDQTRFLLKENETITGIKHQQNMQQEKTIYNLQGQKIKTPRKGIFIMDGKKMIFK